MNRRPLSPAQYEREMLTARIRSIACTSCGAAIDQPCTRKDWATGEQVPREGMDCVRRVREALSPAAGGG